MTYCEAEPTRRRSIGTDGTRISSSQPALNLLGLTSAAKGRESRGSLPTGGPVEFEHQSSFSKVSLTGFLTHSTQFDLMSENLLSFLFL